VLTVLNTNILISALLFRGETAGIHRAILEGRILPLLTAPILTEYLRVLAYPKLGLVESEIHYLVNMEIRPWFQMLTEPVPQESWIPEDPSDDPFINAARVRPGTLLMSGDRHILQIRDRLPVTVLTARELLEILPS